MSKLSKRFHQKSFFKKILYSGLNGGMPSTFENGWAVLGYSSASDPAFKEAVEY